MEYRKLTQNPIRHYYGDFVRVIFIIGAVLTILGLPTITKTLGVPAIIPIIMAAILAVIAGITNPAQRFSFELNVAISILYFVVFGYVAWSAYEMNLKGIIAFMFQVNTILFLIASYFSVKSLRGSIVPEKQ